MQPLRPSECGGPFRQLLRWIWGRVPQRVHDPRSALSLPKIPLRTQTAGAGYLVWEPCLKTAAGTWAGTVLGNRPSGILRWRGGMGPEWALEANTKKTCAQRNGRSFRASLRAQDPSPTKGTQAERDRPGARFGSEHPDLWREAPRLKLPELPCGRRVDPAEPSRLLTLAPASASHQPNLC